MTKKKKKIKFKLKSKQNSNLKKAKWKEMEERKEMKPGLICYFSIRWVRRRLGLSRFPFGGPGYKNQSEADLGLE